MMRAMRKLFRRRVLPGLLLALLDSATTGCITRPAAPDPEQSAVGLEADLEMTLVDHTRRREQALSSGWTLGGVYYATHATGIANRVVRAVAHATAKTLGEAGVPSRP
jgi:hypothetical protein